VIEPAVRRLSALVVSFFIAFGLMIQGALPARGCSCMPPNPYAGLAQADGAFVGTLVEVDRGVGPISNSGQPIDFYFEVEATLKGDIRETVVVKSAADGGACGIEVPVGTRAGFLLTAAGGEWEGNLCWTLDPDVLLSAAEGLPEPVTGSPPHLIVAADMGDAGLMALDRQGQIVGYGEGPFPWMVSACPDHETFIGATSDTTVKVWSFTNLGVIDEFQLDTTGGAWLAGLLCAGPAGNPLLAIKVLSGVEKSTLVRYADGVTEVVAENIERLVDTADGPVAIGSDGTVYRVEDGTGILTPLGEPIGDVQGQIVAAVPSPDGSHLAISAVDWESAAPDGRVFVIDLEQGTSAKTGFACDIYPVWMDDERVYLHDSCTSDVGLIYSTDLEVIGEGQPADYAHTAYVTDETGAIFYPSEFAINVVEVGMETGSELTRLFTYPGAMLLVPPSARSNWEGSVFTAAPLVDTPPTTFSEAPAPGVPGPDTTDPESPLWLMFVGLAAVGGVSWLLLRRPAASEATEPRG